jgi:hypothetical protein
MLDAIMAVIAVVAGAAATFAFRQWKFERERRGLLLTRYLAQLQDACESLWYRLKNVAYESADLVSGPEYLDTTTMYALGRTLGIERMLAVEGLYPEIQKRFPELNSALRPRLVDDAVKAATTDAGKELQQCDRVALAEAIVERDGERLHPSLFLEFRRRVEGNGSERSWWEPVRASASGLTNSGDAVRPLMKAVKELALALSAVTKMDSALAKEPDP